MTLILTELSEHRVDNAADTRLTTTYFSKDGKEESKEYSEVIKLHPITELIARISSHGVGLIEGTLY